MCGHGYRPYIMHLIGSPMLNGGSDRQYYGNFECKWLFSPWWRINDDYTIRLLLIINISGGEFQRISLAVIIGLRHPPDGRRPLINSRD